jgi:Zn-dependent protease
VGDANQWGAAILYVIAFILCITVHEYGHALVATKLGDTLPRLQGRLTLNPKHHIDPIGTLAVPLLGFIMHAPLLAWGRPVQTNPLRYTRKLSTATGHMLVALAGPMMNLVMAAAVSLVVIVGARTGVLGLEIGINLIRYLVILNITLFFFNLLPIPPLDGGAVLAWFLPRSMQGVIDFLNRWGFAILLGLMIAPQLGIPGLSLLMRPCEMVIRAWVGVVQTAAWPS